MTNDWESEKEEECRKLCEAKGWSYPRLRLFALFLARTEKRIAPTPNRLTLEKRARKK